MSRKMSRLSRKMSSLIMFVRVGGRWFQGGGGAVGLWEVEKIPWFTFNRAHNFF